MGVTLFWFHDREQDHGLVPLGNVCPAISPIQQQAMACREACPFPQDVPKGGPFSSRRELPVQGGIFGFRQESGDHWMVKKPRPETCVRRQVVAAVAEAKLMRGGVISEL